VSSDVVRGDFRAPRSTYHVLRTTHHVVFYAYIKEMHGSKTKYLAKYLVRKPCVEGFNSIVKGLTASWTIK
jgi:hypothetical protein